MDNPNAGKKILIIEDDVFLGDVLLQKLVKDGFSPTLVQDGAEGFKAIKSIMPDLILLDIVLPTMNGYEILEAKIKDSTIASIPVIVVSNSGQPVEINRVLALGVNEYIVKAQFDPEEVMVKVRNQLKKDGKSLDTTLSATPAAPNISLEGKKIMWVEDDKFLNDIISRKLASQKCTYLHSDNGEEAIQIIQKEQPDVILLDIILSGIDGFEILRRIKADEKIKNIPVILVSNLSQDTDTKKGKELGAVSFLIKATVTLDDILDEAKKVIIQYPKK